MLNKVEIKLEMQCMSNEISRFERGVAMVAGSEITGIVTVGATDLGRRRRVNEDGFVLNERMGLSLVVDGMGGHDHGVLATQTILNQFQAKLEHFYHKDYLKMYPHCEARAFLADVIEHVNTMVYTSNIRHGYSDGAGMGAVIAGLWWVEPGKRAIIFHVGDSRLYLYRKAELTQLTLDHTMYQLWKMRGEQGAAPPGNVIFRAIGPRREVLPEIQLMEFVAGDLIVICSDGLSAVLSNEELLQILESNQDAVATLPQRLIAEANAKGGPDNITAVVIQLSADLL